MTITIDGDGTITGLSAGGLPNNSVQTADIADDQITLAKLAGGTDGQIITYDASGNPTAVGPGDDGQVLTSTGPGSPPAFEAIPAGGVTHGATWRLTTSFTGNAQPEIASNWEEVDTGAYSTLGSGISESSGIFSLPATGYWFIIFSLQIQHNGTTRYTQMSLETTTNDSTYAEVAFCSESAQYTGNSATGGATGSYIMDVTDTSNCKFKFAVSSDQSTTTINGNTGHNWTSFTAFRLADT